jgi:intein-encoded DNA endonuclease-like protein
MVYYEVKYSSQPLGLFLEQPLHKLKPFIEGFPLDFLRGLFSADGCGCVTIAHQKLSPIIMLSNSNLLLLQESARLLESGTGIRSAIRMDRQSGTILAEGGRRFFLRQNAFSLQIGKFDDVCSFAKKIGFAIKRKQQRIEHAIQLIKTMGRSEAAEEWSCQYFKERNSWRKRATRMILSETVSSALVRGGGPDRASAGIAWSKMPISA